MLGGRMLVCIRERGGEIVIPSGATELMSGDKISVVMPTGQIASVLHRLNLRQRPIRAVTIAGGGSIAVYLGATLLRAGIQVKIIERDRARCEELADRLPKAQIICGDCGDKQLLSEEGLPSAEAFVCLTDLDEENIMLALYAAKVSRAKVVTKISRIDFEEVVEDLNLGSVVHPKNLTAENIVRYVRALENASGNRILFPCGHIGICQFVIGSIAANETVLKELCCKLDFHILRDHGLIPTNAHRRNTDLPFRADCFNH